MNTAEVKNLLSTSDSIACLADRFYTVPFRWCGETGVTVWGVE